MNLFEIVLALGIFVVAHMTSAAIGYHYGAKNQRRMLAEAREGLEVMRQYFEDHNNAPLPTLANESPRAPVCYEGEHNFIRWPDDPRFKCTKCGAHAP